MEGDTEGGRVQTKREGSGSAADVSVGKGSAQSSENEKRRAISGAEKFGMEPKVFFVKGTETRGSPAARSPGNRNKQTGNRVELQGEFGERETEVSQPSKRDADRQNETSPLQQGKHTQPEEGT